MIVVKGLSKQFKGQTVLNGVPTAHSPQPRSGPTSDGRAG